MSVAPVATIAPTTAIMSATLTVGGRLVATAFPSSGVSGIFSLTGSGERAFILRAAVAGISFRAMNSDSGPFSYDSIASEYASKVDSAPYNALYERPAMLSLLPDVDGARILDAGCGSGWYAERLIERGAAVEAIDASPRMAGFARERLNRLPGGAGARARVQVADLSNDLPFESGSFGGVLSPLVMHYLEDWRPTL